MTPISENVSSSLMETWIASSVIDAEEKKKQVVYSLSDTRWTNERRTVTIPEIILEI